MEVQSYKKTTPSRITIVLDGEIESKLREIQGQLISSHNKGFSLSKIINMVLLSGMLGANKLTGDEWRIIRTLTKKRRICLSGLSVSDFVEMFPDSGTYI